MSLGASPSSRAAVIVAIAAIALSVLFAFVVQLGLLGALGLGNINTELAFEPESNTSVAKLGDTTGLAFDPSRGAAVARAKSLRLAANDALAVVLHTDEVTRNLRLTLAWLSTQDIRRPATATTQLRANGKPQHHVLLLAGHSRWRDTVTQVVVALESTGARTGASSAFLSRAELLPATPFGGARLMAAAWFQRDGSILTPTESAHRLLPLALWLVLVCVSSLLLSALPFRKNPQRRADALRICAMALAVGAVLVTVLANRWPGWTLPLAGGVAAALALLLLDRTVLLKLSRWSRIAITVLLAGLAAWMSPLVAAVSVLPGLMLLLGPRRIASDAPAAPIDPWLRAGGLLALIPALALAAIAQGLIAAPNLLNPLADPTPSLVSVATIAGGLPALGLGLLTLHLLWPAPAKSPRWSNRAVAAWVWAMTGAVAVLAIPKIAVLAEGASSYVALFVPALTCLGLAAWPKLQTVAQSVDDTVAVEAKSEADLSAQALVLLESHAERVATTLSRGEVGAARSALNQMRVIASAARATALAELRLALIDADSTAAESAAARIENPVALTAGEHDALLELAHRNQRHSRVIELAAGASPTEGNLRATALAQLLTQGIAPAAKALASWPDPHTFALEMAELHLLNDDLSATQQALENTGIAMTAPSGQAYIARLGMRALGAQAYAEGINGLATWHPQLGVAQAALGELMLQQGNAVGARARFLLAVTIDPRLWALQYRLQQIAPSDAQAPATSAAMTPIMRAAQNA